MSGAPASLDSRERSLGELAAEIHNGHRRHLRELWVEVVPGGVLIRGVATSYYGKQVALHEVRRRCGLLVTANQIVVVVACRKQSPSDPVGG